MSKSVRPRFAIVATSVWFGADLLLTFSIARQTSRRSSSNVATNSVFAAAARGYGYGRLSSVPWLRSMPNMRRYALRRARADVGRIQLASE